MNYTSARIEIKHYCTQLAYIKLAFRTVFDEMQNDNPNITLNFSWTWIEFIILVEWWERHIHTKTLFHDLVFFEIGMC